MLKEFVASVNWFWVFGLWFPLVICIWTAFLLQKIDLSKSETQKKANKHKKIMMILSVIGAISIVLGLFIKDLILISVGFSFMFTLMISALMISNKLKKYN